MSRSFLGLDPLAVQNVADMSALSASQMSSHHIPSTIRISSGNAVDQIDMLCISGLEPGWVAGGRRTEEDHWRLQGVQRADHIAVVRSPIHGFVKASIVSLPLDGDVQYGTLERTH